PRAAVARRTRKAGMIVVFDPFGGIAGHVEDTEWARAREMTPDRLGRIHAARAAIAARIEVGQAAIRQAVAPRIAASVGAARGFFPLGFRWQPFARPGAKGVRVVPGHADDRVIGPRLRIPVGWKAVAGRRSGTCARVDAARVRRLRDLGAVDL